MNTLSNVRKRKSKKNKPLGVNNAELTECLSVWIKNNKTTGQRTPIPELVGRAIINITDIYSKKKNFVGYTYLEDMKADAILTCIKYLHNFNPEKSSNAFGYISLIVVHAFQGILNKEKKQRDIKAKLYSLNPYMEKTNYKKNADI